MDDDQLTINDLPVECIDEILKWITDRVDRIYARFVCKLWCALIDQDCSAECYLVDSWKVGILTRGFKTNAGRAYFIEIFAPLINSRRKKTSFYLDRVDFQGSEQFWRGKGKGIISLSFGYNCANIPLSDISEHCISLKTLSFYMGDSKTEDELKILLRNCIANGKKNYSVRSVDLVEIQSLDDVIIINIASIARLVGQVFLGVRKVFFNAVSTVYAYNFDWADNIVNSFSTVFENLKFVIVISNRKGTFEFDPSGNVPVKMIALKISYEETMDNISKELTRYSCGHAYLNKLKLDYRIGNCVLDDFRELITQYPSLTSLSILVRNSGNYLPLTNPLSKNNIEDLSLSGRPGESCDCINDAFLQSFEGLKIFECRKLFFSDFLKLLRKLPCLEILKFDEGVVDDVNPKESISNERLIELRIPVLFLLQTIAKYNFSNLKKLELRDFSYKQAELNPLELLVFDVQLLERINCPNLEIFELHKPTIVDPSAFNAWIVKFSALFPRLIKFVYFLRHPLFGGWWTGKSGDKFAMNNKTLKTILANNRRLIEIGNRSIPQINPTFAFTF